MMNDPYKLTQMVYHIIKNNPSAPFLSRFDVITSNSSLISIYFNFLNYFYFVNMFFKNFLFCKYIFFQFCIL